MSLWWLINPKLITEKEYDLIMGICPPIRVPKNELTIILNRSADNQKSLIDARSNPEPVTHKKWIDWDIYPIHDVYIHVKQCDKEQFYKYTTPLFF